MQRPPSRRWTVALFSFALGAAVAVAVREELPRRFLTAVGLRGNRGDPAGPVTESIRLRQTLAAGTTRQVALLGDSITEFGRWEGDLGGFHLINAGVSGNTTADLLARLPALERQPPAWVLVMAGINDIFSGVEPRRTLANHEAIVTRLKAAGSQVVLVSVLPLSKQNAYYRETNAEVETLNAALRALAARQRVAFFDLVPVFAAPGEFVLADEYTVDSVHLNSLAYALWTLRLRTYLATLSRAATPGQPGAGLG